MKTDKLNMPFGWLSVEKSTNLGQNIINLMYILIGIVLIILLL